MQHSLPLGPDVGVLPPWQKGGCRRRRYSTAHVAIFPIVPLAGRDKTDIQGIRQATLSKGPPMKRYSVFAIAKEALSHHMGWERAWA
jgi:hypothetical protein